MYAPSPEKIKVIKDLSRQEIVFALAKTEDRPHLLRRFGLHGLGRRPGQAQAGTERAGQA